MAASILPDVGHLAGYFTLDRGLAAARAAIILALALVAAKVVERGLGQVLGQRLAAEQRLLLLRVARFGLLGLAGTWALREMGFDVGVLLGAAGALTVALGFASQTSASNLISGLFLIVEQPFGIGDIIEVGGITGQVLSIDLLSAKLKTPDSQFVRIPNETILKSPLVNLTRFDDRQQTLIVPLDPGAEPEGVCARVLEAVGAVDGVLAAPAPQVYALDLDGTALQLKIMVWSRRVQMAPVRSRVLAAVRARLDQDHVGLGRRWPWPPAA